MSEKARARRRPRPDEQFLGWTTWMAACATTEAMLKQRLDGSGALPEGWGICEWSIILIETWRESCIVELYTSSKWCYQVKQWDSLRLAPAQLTTSEEHAP